MEAYRAHPPPHARPRPPFGHAMSNFHFATNLIIELEGGDKVHKHPNDPGGTTKYGISQRAHPNIDVPNLTRGAAKAIYREHYWNPVTSRVHEPAMQILVYDSAIQHGTQTALGWYREHKTFDAYMAHRVRYYTSLDTWSTFGAGWLNRLAAIMDAADEVRRDSHTVRLMIDHRPLVTRLRHAMHGQSGPAKLRVRPLVAGDGKKLDIDVA